jgi:hypothetical protein
MRTAADPPQLLDYEPPAGRRLKRRLQLGATEPLEKPAHRPPIRRRDPPARQLTALGVKPLGGDLRPMLVKSHHDRHHVSPRVEHRTREQRSARPITYRGSRSALRRFE